LHPPCPFDRQRRGVVDRKCFGVQKKKRVLGDMVPVIVPIEGRIPETFRGTATDSLRFSLLSIIFEVCVLMVIAFFCIS